MSEYSENESPPRKKKGRRDWDEASDPDREEEALKPSRNTLDVRIVSRGFKNKLESKEYQKFKARPNKGFKVEKMTLGELLNLNDTGQITGEEKRIGGAKRRK